MAHAAAPTATKVFIDGSGPPNTRYNIFELSTAKECEIQYSLYLRALLVIQAAQITDPLSYYRLAGIYQHFPFLFLPFHTIPILVN